MKSKSADVIGDPSSHTASGFNFTVMVKGFSVMPPFSSVGSSAISEVALKPPSPVVNQSPGSTLTCVVQISHDEFAHWVIGLMHSGHCSAPMVIVPPVGVRSVAAAVVPALPPLAVVPAPPPVVLLLLPLSSPHAAANKPRPSSKARTLTLLGVRLT